MKATYVLLEGYLGLTAGYRLTFADPPVPPKPCSGPRWLSSHRHRLMGKTMRGIIGARGYI